MSLPVKIDGEIKGSKDLTDALKKITRGLVTGDLLKELSSSARETILERTAAGRDYRGERFRPYSKGWKAERAKRGKSTQTVDLNFEGKMLEDIRAGVDVMGGEARVYFASPASEGKKAFYHNVSGAGGSKVKREFFGLGEADRDALVKIVGDHIEEVLSSTRRG